MELEKIIESLESKEVGSDVINAVKALDQSGEVARLKGELDDLNGVKTGILADKKRYKSERDEARARLKKIEDEKLPENERYEKQIAEMQKQLEDERLEREQQKSDFAKQQREAKLADLTASVKWAQGTPHETAKLIVSNAMTGIEDLSDSSKVDEVLKSLTESHASFIEAKAPSGTGDKTGKVTEKPGDDNQYTLADSVNDAWKNK